MGVARGQAIGDERARTRSESSWHESRALDADVAAVWQASIGDEAGAPVRRDRVDASTVLVRGDEVTGEATERGRGDRNAALELWRVARDCRDRAATV